MNQTFKLFLKKTARFFIHDKNLQLLLTEIYKTIHNPNPSFMKETFIEKTHGIISETYHEFRYQNQKQTAMV